MGPFTVLAQRLPAGGPLGAGTQDVLGGHRPVLAALLRDLGRGCAARYAALWLPVEADGRAVPRWAPAAEWRPRTRAPEIVVPEPVDDPVQLLAAPGVFAMVDVADAGVRRGILVLAHRDPGGPRTACPTRLGEAAVCAGLLLRQARHHAAAASARARVDLAARHLGVTRLELSTVQAVERDRLATAVTAAPGRQLAGILARAEELDSALRAGSPEAGPIAVAIRTGLHEMIEQFRIVVRGVYPQVLRRSGVRVALEEVAASLPVPAVFHGELGRRQGWEVESALYQAAASAMAVLGDRGGGEPVHVRCGRAGDGLTIRVQRAGTDPASGVEALRDDSRRLAALGGRLTVGPGPGPTGTVVDIRLPERLGAGPAAASRAVAAARSPRPAGGAEPPAVSAGKDVPGTGPALRGLLDLLVTGRAASADTAAARVGVDRQDGRVRVAVVGEQAENLVPLLCGHPGDADRIPPAGAWTPPICYQYRPCPRITLDPGRGGPPWRPIRLLGWSAVAWPEAATGLDRILVEGPAEALRGMRLAHYRDRVDAGLAARLRHWSGVADGPPDAVVLVLDAPAGAAEQEFLTALRAPEEDGFTPVTICALRDGAEVPARSLQQLRAVSDAVVGWRPVAGGTSDLQAQLQARVHAWADAVAARWALRTLQAWRVSGQVDEELAGAVESAAVGAHEVAELDLAQALQGGRITLPHGHAEAVRLLGGHGTDPRSRLGLAADATPGQVRLAAQLALAFWRTRSMAPDGGPAGRGASAVLVRACERLHLSGPGEPGDVPPGAP